MALATARTVIVLNLGHNATELDRLACLICLKHYLLMLLTLNAIALMVWAFGAGNSC